MTSPFERNAPSPKTSKAKIVMLIALAGGLGLVTMYNSSVSKVRSADASATGNGAAPAAVTGGSGESAAEAMAKLAADPTAKLLRQNPELPTALENPPINPFTLSPKWTALLVKADERPAPLVEQNSAPTPTPRPASINTDQIKLQGIFVNATRSYAIVNNQVVSAGATVAGVRVIEVAEDHLLCEPIGRGESSRFTLQLKSKSQ